MDVTTLVTLLLLGMAAWHFVWVRLGVRHLVRPWLTAHRAVSVMSHHTPAQGAARPVAPTVAATATSDGQRIATPSTAVNDSLTGNLLPEEAREIIRFQAKAEALADLVNAGKVPQAEGIEIVFHCTRSGRRDSAYGRARAAIQARTTPPEPQYRAYPGELAKFAEVANGSEE